MINPIKATSRYANIALTGFKGKPFSTYDPALNTPVGRADTAIYNAANWGGQNKLAVGAGAVGAIAANQMLGNPVGGVTDALTFGLTNFRPDAETGSEPPQMIIMQQPGMERSTSQAGVPTQPLSLPALNEEDRKRQLQYLQRKVATDLITMQGLQPQGGGEYGDY